MLLVLTIFALIKNIIRVHRVPPFSATITSDPFEWFIILLHIAINFNFKTLIESQECLQGK